MSIENKEQDTTDLSKVDLERGAFRGPTPHDIEEICLKLCQQYLGGVWLNINTDEIKVKRVSGGITNQLYYCALNEDSQINGGKEPKEVAILLYGDKFFNKQYNESNKRLTDTVIALLISENGLGPKIYGLFEGGQIQKWYQQREFQVDEQNDPTMVGRVATKLAYIHALDVPIKKTGNWIFDFFDDNYKLANERFNLEALFDECNSDSFKNYDIGQEFEWLKKTMIDFNSPQTFSHVDFRPSNIMITETNEIILCDFEYSCYGYRGFDFGSMFCEWGQVWGQWDYSLDFPSEHIIKPFIDSYIEESVKLNGKKFREDIRNSFENILKETKLFSLAGLMWILMFHLPDKESIIEGMPFNKIRSIVRKNISFTKPNLFFLRTETNGNVL